MGKNAENLSLPFIKFSIQLFYDKRFSIFVLHQSKNCTANNKYLKLKRKSRIIRCLTFFLPTFTKRIKF